MFRSDLNLSELSKAESEKVLEQLKMRRKVKQAVEAENYTMNAKENFTIYTSKPHMIALRHRKQGNSPLELLSTDHNLSIIWKHLWDRFS